MIALPFIAVCAASFALVWLFSEDGGGLWKFLCECTNAAIDSILDWGKPGKN